MGKSLKFFSQMANDVQMLVLSGSSETTACSGNVAGRVLELAFNN